MLIAIFLSVNSRLIFYPNLASLYLHKDGLLTKLTSISLNFGAENEISTVDNLFGNRAKYVGSC